MKQLASLSLSEAYQHWLTGSAVLLDIRDEQHFRTAHVPGATHVASSAWLTLVPYIERDTLIMVMCYHGISSRGMVYQLMQQDFKQVYNIEGGFERWAVVYPVETTC